MGKVWSISALGMNGADNAMIVGRAATGIYLALLESNCTSGYVLVPGNLCYAGIYPALYAGLLPVFCDVDSRTGNVTLETITQVWQKDGIRAAVIPHMYGNPVLEMQEIYDFLHERGVVVIEDCASAMGASAETYQLGRVGDYTVYSTGYAKTLDLGYGGFLRSRYTHLEAAREREKTLPMYSEKQEKNQAFFSKLYRMLRNEGTDTAIESMIYRGLLSCCRDDFLLRIGPEQQEKLLQEMERLPEIVEERRRKKELYRKRLSCWEYNTYPYTGEAVPWRYNLMVDKAERKSLIYDCLAGQIPISDWYPNVTPFFGKRKTLHGVDQHAASIVNFPLTIEDVEICKICDFLNMWFQKNRNTPSEDTP